MKFNWKGNDWYIDGYLATQLNSIVYNIKDDWDFVILVTGDRMVRVGKSILAMTVSAYLAWSLAKKNLNNDAYNHDCLFFDNKEMIDSALSKDKYFVDHYDEGREGLAANKAMQQVTKDLIDFFTECGQLNHIFVVVAPDFFELKEDMAVGRSEILINVYRQSQQKMVDMYGEGKIPIIKFSRGYFEFFSRKRKADLYDMFKTRRKKNYHAVPCDFRGRFTDQYPIDKELYLKKKKEALERFKDRHKKEIKVDIKSNRKNTMLKEFIKEKAKREGRTEKNICEEKGINYDYYTHWETSIEKSDNKT